MPPERVSQPAMPAVTLAAQHLERGRGLRPGDRIGNKLDPVRPPLLVAPAPQPQDQFYILAHRILGIATGGDDRIPPEQTKSPGDNEIAPQPVPAQPSEQEGPQILHRLDPGEPMARAARHYHSARLYLSAVHHPDCPAGGQHLIAHQEWLDHAE